MLLACFPPSSWTQTMEKQNSMHIFKWKFLLYVVYLVREGKSKERGNWLCLLKVTQRLWTVLFSEKLLSWSFLLGRPGGPVVAEVLTDAQSHLNMFSAYNPSSETPRGLIPKQRGSEIQILYYLPDLFLQYVQTVIKRLSSAHSLIRKCYRLHCPLVVISQPKIWWGIELPLNHSFCKYIFPWEKTALGSFPIIFCNKCLLRLMTVSAQSWEEYYFCWFSHSVCWGIDGFCGDGLAFLRARVIL